eukprot:354033_1
MYPLLILPYFFRAYRIKKIYDEATTTHNMHNRDMNIFRSARTQSLLSANIIYGNIHTESVNDTSTKTKSVISTANAHNHTIQSVQSVHSASGIKQRSNSLMSQGGNDSGSFKFDENALSYSSKLDKRLIKIFLLCLIPFIIMSITNYFSNNNHLLPTFIKSCDNYYKSSAIFIWVIIHAGEIFILILIVYW